MLLMNDAACRPTAVVAIPVRNEAERIKGCLKALAAQTGVEAGRIGTILFLNNCMEETAQVVASVLPGLGMMVRVVEQDFAGTNAGWARREVMEAVKSHPSATPFSHPMPALAHFWCSSAPIAW